VSRPLSFTLAGLAGTVVLAVVVGGFIRLGFWQLDRLGERRAENRAIAARLDAPPIADVAALRDTAGLFYRSVVARGTYDNDRTIIFPGRSRRGLPGVYVLTPLRVPGHEALLVNRGWVPSPDAATVDLSLLEVHDTVTVHGLVLPFPDASESLAPAERVMPGDSAFRRIWFAVDEATLRAQFPYPLAQVSLQELPLENVDSTMPRYPARLEPPALGEGSHLGYALQWFSFATIGIIGWIALVLRSRSTVPRSAPPAIVLLLLAFSANGARAQLRPLEPMPWRIFEGRTWGLVEAGAGLLDDHAATLAGARGTLFEGGIYRIVVRSGRMSMEAGGTAVWRLDERSTYAAPLDGVRAADDGVRSDAGVLYAASSLRMSPDGWPLDVVVRFGATVPTTSDESGLDRDRTDFFALLGARWRSGPLTLTAENGVGIHGTLQHANPQSDVWVFAFGASWDVDEKLRAVGKLVGRQDGHAYVIRGNEDLHELRLGFDYGTRVIASARYVRGITRYSPAHGVRAGLALRVGPTR